MIVLGERIGLEENDEERLRGAMDEDAMAMEKSEVAHCDDGGECKVVVWLASLSPPFLVSSVNPLNDKEG